MYPILYKSWFYKDRILIKNVSSEKSRILDIDGLGFIRLHGFHIIIISEREKVGSIAGNEIYKVSKVTIEKIGDGGFLSYSQVLLTEKNFLFP
ncbi:hypothetical protein AYI69_g5003 [Smittium culicis]|uniref:Uncharacterized protein n=1 Tax=Smittium culicis TaxID=133412 RepID=A0A1R1Y963_9FUNG|nr:hypothetical protein AYI69_g5003 [Smittium culicis]